MYSYNKAAEVLVIQKATELVEDLQEKLQTGYYFNISKYSKLKI